MEVILLENIDKLGTRGQVVKVADGFGRNYLLPKKLAVAASPQNRKWVDQQRVRFLKLEAKEKADSQDLAKLLEGVTITMVRKTGDKGNLFGSVTALDVAEGLAAQGYKIDRRKVQLDPPLKILGEYDVPIKLHREVVATVKVKVEPDAESKPRIEAATAASAAKAEARAKAQAAEAAAPEAQAAEGEAKADADAAPEGN
jgi:large subunit ribosomal protein L9